VDQAISLSRSAGSGLASHISIIVRHFYSAARSLSEDKGRATEIVYLYLVKDEAWIGLYGSTTLFVMEEKEMAGVYPKHA
jgi:hypothetical protein